MTAYTIHAYSTDSTEGVVITKDDLTEDQVIGLWWAQNKSKGANPIQTWADLNNLFAIKRDLTEL
jgi:hypothetical protein